MNMQTEYNGYIIGYTDWSKFCISSKDAPETIIKREVPTLEACTKWIDAQGKKKWARLPVLYLFDYWHGDREEAFATSVIDDKYVWVVSKAKKERSKAKFEDVWTNTCDNIERIRFIKSRKQIIEQAKKEIDECEANAERLRPSDMIELNGGKNEHEV